LFLIGIADKRAKSKQGGLFSFQVSKKKVGSMDELESDNIQV